MIPYNQNSLRTLYITYDGLLDHLGGSQILPYLLNISTYQQYLHVISFEKQDKYIQDAGSLMSFLSDHRIKWTPLSFTKRGGKFGKLWDLIQMHSAALFLYARHNFTIIHCRSYQAMQVGLMLRRLGHVKTIFDMRGLWVDDRIEGGLWPQDKLFFRLLYKFYKRMEQSLLENSDEIVVLTKRVLPEIQRIAPNARAQVTVIPCCADFDHFFPSRELRDSSRLHLGIGSKALVLVYPGSLGTIYLFKDVLRLISIFRRKQNNLHFLILTGDWNESCETLISESGLSDFRSNIHVKSAKRSEMPFFLAAADIMISFRKTTYSQIACSPTKLAEGFAMGIPVISNLGVGDVEIITRDLDAGALVDLDNPLTLEQIAIDIEGILSKGGLGLRDRSRRMLGIEAAHESYKDIYLRLSTALN